MPSTARDIANEHTARLTAAFGPDITPAKTAECARAGQLLAIADMIRTRLIDEGVADFSSLISAEQMADMAVAQLRLPPVAKPKVGRIQVTYVSRFDGKLENLLKELRPELAESELIRELGQRITELEGENEALKNAVAVLERECAALRVSGQLAEEKPHPEPPEGQQMASGMLSNVVSFDPRGNGSAIVNRDLAERYPNLRFDPPVGKW
jgi:hypothetical protein